MAHTLMTVITLISSKMGGLTAVSDFYQATFGWAEP